MNCQCLKQAMQGRIVSHAYLGFPCFTFIPAFIAIFLRGSFLELHINLQAEEEPNDSVNQAVDHLRLQEFCLRHAQRQKSYSVCVLQFVCHFLANTGYFLLKISSKVSYSSVLDISNQIGPPGRYGDINKLDYVMKIKNREKTMKSLTGYNDLRRKMGNICLQVHASTPV